MLCPASDAFVAVDEVVVGVLNIANTLPQTVAPFLAGTLVIPVVNSVFAGAGYSVWFVVGGCVAIAGGLLVYKIKGVR